MKRILVVGTSGAGKSTLAEALARKLGLPYFASDPFYWEAGWRLAPAEKTLRLVTEVVTREAWVLDGNFDTEHDLVWGRADCIVWLDYGLGTIFWRVATRNLGWLISGRPVWAGNRMNAGRAISGIGHALKSYPLKKRDYPQWLADRSGTAIHRFQSSREAEAWLRSLGRGTNGAHIGPNK